MGRYARKNLADLLADKGADSVTMVLANFHDVDDNDNAIDRAVVAFVDDEAQVSYTGAVILSAENQTALKEYCRSAWNDGNPLVTITKGAEGSLPVLTADIPVSDGQASEEALKEEAPSA